VACRAAATAVSKPKDVSTKEHRAAELVDPADSQAGESHRLVARLLDQALVAEPEPVYVLDAVLFPQPDDDRTDGVVEAGAQPATGDDPALQHARMEEDPLSRAGQLERRRLDTG
jgi:hypothetical protein